MPIPSALPFFNIRWDDILFMTFAGIMLGAGILVVTMKDIIRCGLAMIVCFGALAGLYVVVGAPLVAGAQVLVYIGAISVLGPVRDHAHPEQIGPGPARLPDPGRAGRDRLGRAGRHASP